MGHSRDRARTYYVRPQRRSGPFFLLAAVGGWTLGPFTADDWGEAPDVALVWADGVTHPVVLRVRRQDGETIQANDGDVREMSYTIVPVSQAPREWLAPRSGQA